jgi:ATP-dependent Clp protease ATP-binding subunit ClpX
LRAVLEDRMLEIMYDIPSRGDVSKCIMTKDSIIGDVPPMLVTVEKKPGAGKKKEETA